MTAAELAKAKKISLGHSLGSLTTMRGQASDLGSNWLVTRNLNFTRDYLEAMQKVSLEDIQRVARRYLVEDNLTVVSLNPRGTLAPKATEAVAVTAGEVEKFELSNGLRLLVREDPRLPLVSMVATFRGGLLAESRGDQRRHPPDGEGACQRHDDAHGRANRGHDRSGRRQSSAATPAITASVFRST